MNTVITLNSSAKKHSKCTLLFLNRNMGIYTIVRIKTHKSQKKFTTVDDWTSFISKKEINIYNYDVETRSIICEYFNSQKIGGIPLDDFRWINLKYYCDQNIIDKLYWDLIIRILDRSINYQITRSLLNIITDYLISYKEISINVKPVPAYNYDFEPSSPLPNFSRSDR